MKPTFLKVLNELHRRHRAERLDQGPPSYGRVSELARTLSLPDADVEHALEALADEQLVTYDALGHYTLTTLGLRRVDEIATRKAGE
jgi:Mn-dependent DtxR family transcriptional regulator